MLPSSLDTYAYQCGFLRHIQRINKTHKQIRLSAYVFFCVRKDIFQLFLLEMQQTALSCRDLVRKEITEQGSLPFMTRKGVKNDEAIFFSRNHRKPV